MDVARLNYGTVEQIIFSACLGVEYITGKNKDGSAKNIIYRNIIQACGGYGEKEQSVDVLVDACET